MNWNKAVNILLVMFIVVNSILAGVNYKKNVSAYRLSQRRIENVVKVLGEENIGIGCELPQNFKPTQSLWTEPLEITSQMRDQLVDSFYEESKEQIVITQMESLIPYGKMRRVYRSGNETLTFGGTSIEYVDESILVGNGVVTENEAQKQAKAFLKRLGLDKKFKNGKSEYRSESYGALITYYEVYEGIPLFDSYAIMEVTPYGVAKFYGQSVNVVKSSSEPNPLYPIDKVLYGLQDEELFQNPIMIEDITLGYGVENSEGMHILKEEAIPMYKIKCVGLDESVFVNAYTNAIEDRGTSYFYK